MNEFGGNVNLNKTTTPDDPIFEPNTGLDQKHEVDHKYQSFFNSSIIQMHIDFVVEQEEERRKFGSSQII